MPVCFQLLRDDKPVPLAQVDNEICAHFSVTPDPISYYERWYDIIGLRLALGHSKDEILGVFTGEYHNDTRLKEITEYIFDNFSINNFRSANG